MKSLREIEGIFFGTDFPEDDRKITLAGLSGEVLQLGKYQTNDTRSDPKNLDIRRICGMFVLTRF